MFDILWTSWTIHVWILYATLPRSHLILNQNFSWIFWKTYFKAGTETNYQVGFFANMRKEFLNSVYKYGKFACYTYMMKKNANLSDSTYYIRIHTYLRNLSIFFCHALLLVRKRITPYSAKDENTKSMQTKTHKSIAFM